MADCAIDVDHFSTCAADQVVVVVIDPILIAGRRSGGLDSTEDTLLGQDTEGIVDRLSRDDPDFGANALGNVIRGAMGPNGHRPQDSQSLGGDGDSIFAKQIVQIRHGSISREVLDSVKNWKASIFPGWPVMSAGLFCEEADEPPLPVTLTEALLLACLG